MRSSVEEDTTFDLQARKHPADIPAYLLNGKQTLALCNESDWSQRTLICEPDNGRLRITVMFGFS